MPYRQKVHALNRFLIAWILLLAFSAASGGESSEPVSNLWENKFQLRVGVFFPDLDSSIRIDSDLGRVGDGLDFERDLGMPDHKSTFYGGASWQFSPKHVVEWEFFDLGRDGQISAERSWDIGDTTILADGQIDSAFNVRINRLTYKYRFFESSRTNMNVMAGLHGTRLQTRLALSGELIVDGEPVFVLPVEARVEVDKTKLPLPHFGLGVNFAFSARLVGFVSVKGFVLEIDDTYGSLIEFDLGIQYRLSERLGIGGGFKSFFLDVVEDENRLTDVNIDFDFIGPAVYMTYTF